MDRAEKELLFGSSGFDDAAAKLCVDCKTTRTPLWRSGPAGPKSLCNACGIRYRKKRDSFVVSNKGSDGREEKSSSSSTSCSSAAAPCTSNYARHWNKKEGERGKDGNMSNGLRLRLVALRKEADLLQKQRPSVKRQRGSKRLGEVEQAAVLLMALSYSPVVYA